MFVWKIACMTGFLNTTSDLLLAGYLFRVYPQPFEFWIFHASPTLPIAIFYV